jgi:hypothetical protein
MLESTKMQQIKIYEPEPNEHGSIPIDTIFLVDKLYEVLNFRDFFGKHKTMGIDINNLLQTLTRNK